VVGAVSGLVFAVSTVGSLLGALATGFVLIPNLGVRSILALSGGVLMLTAAVGLFLARRRAPAIVALMLAVVVLAVWRGGAPAETAGRLRTVARIPSFFGSLRVVETELYRMLAVNGVGQNYMPLRPDVRHSDYLYFMGTVPRLHPGSSPRPSGLLIGLGAGELVAMLDGGAWLTAVEIDPRIEQTARRYFGLTLPRERIHIADGRAFLERDTARYDFVFMDAFLGEDVPGHLYTREAFEAVARRLAPGGLIAINFTSIPNGPDVRAVGRTLRAVFPHARAFTDGSPPTGPGSTVFLASASSIELNRAAAAGIPAVELFLANELDLAALGGTLLTDDYNPINAYRLGVNHVWRRYLIRQVGADWTYWADF
jgi:spermidine synthase